MAHAKLAEGLQDVAFTTATPFETDGAVDHEALAANLQDLYKAGARLFIACGNTGEYYALTDEERAAVVRTHVDALPEDKSVTIVGGVGGSTKQAVSLAQQYATAGVDGLLAMHPEFTYLHADGLLEHYDRIATATNRGLVIYKRGPSVPRRVVREVTEHPDVVGVKFAVNDVDEFGSAVAGTDDSVVWLNGIAERFALAFDAEGADGYTTGVGNFAPASTLALWDALQVDDRDTARAIRELLRPIEDIRAESGANNTVGAANNVPVVKYGMDRRGFTGGPCRVPLQPLAERDRQRLDATLDALEAADVPGS